MVFASRSERATIRNVSSPESVPTTFFHFKASNTPTGSVRHAGVTLHQHDMSGKIHPQHRLVEYRLEPALHLGVEAFVVAGNVAIAVGGGSLDEAQLPDVPGKW